MFEVHECVTRPEALAEFLAGNSSARLFEEGCQNLEGLGLQPDLNAMLAEHALIQVDLERAKAGDAPMMTRRLHGSLTSPIIQKVGLPIG